MSFLDTFLAKPAVKRFFEGKTFIGVLVSGVTVMTAVIGFIGKLLSVNAIVANWLSDAVKKNPATQAIELKPITQVVLVGIILSWGVLIALVVWVVTRRFTRTKDQKSLDEIMSSVRQIIAQGKQDGPVKTWTSIHDVYLIGKDFSGIMTRTATVKTVGERLHFFEHKTESEAEADAAESLAALQYRVRDLSGGKNNIVYLPSENEPLRKKACLFFLPPMEKEESRSFEITYEWPGMFKLASKPEDISFRTEILETMSVFRMEIYLQDGVAGRLDCSVTGKRYNNERLQPLKYSMNGWRGAGFKYEATDIPPGNLDVTLRVEVKN